MEVTGLDLYPSDIAEKLEFDFIRDWLKNHCRGELGRSYLAEQSFYTEKDVLEVRLDRVREMADILVNKGNFPSCGSADLHELVQKLGIENIAIPLHQFLDLLKFLQTVDGIFHFFSRKENKQAYPALHAWVESYDHVSALTKALEKVLDLEKETVKESASPRLGELRRAARDKQAELQKVFRQVVSKYRKDGRLADPEESVRNGRRVLAVLAEYKRQVPGILHDESESGKVVFIEPQETVHINNDITEHQLEERREIERILRALSTEIAPFVSVISANMELVGNMDVLQAVADFANTFQCMVPRISGEGRHCLVGARHPVLQFWHKKHKKQVVPLSLELLPDVRVMLISGPNAGGKSVALKTAGILQLMLQFGMMLPVEEGTEMRLFSKIFADVGDQQSIENDLSTYSSHLHNMQHCIRHADADTLLLIDEMGTGTDPAFGGAVAEAILETLLPKGVYGVVTTHYADLKDFATRHPGLQNAAMAFDTQSLTPLYQLYTGRPGSSYTLEIARKSGLDKNVIALARSKAGEKRQQTDETLSEIQNEKQYLKGIRKNLQQKEEQLDELKTHYDRLKRDMEKERKKLIKEFKEKQLEAYNAANRELEKLMREWKEDKADKDKFKQVREQIDQQREALGDTLRKMENEPVQLSAEGPLTPGAKVRLEEGAETGTILEIRNNKAVVQFGGITTNIPLQRLQKVADKQVPKGRTSTALSVNKLEAKSSFDMNIDIRGMYRDEAISTLEQFLDKAILFSMGKVRVIHGIGTGRLKEAVHQYLRKYPNADRFYSEPQEFGGEGVTVVDIS
jgi:DNA mismatch repair protein MutS2